MGETYGLGVAHIEPVRRIATRVAKSSGAGRYFAIGRSEERRNRVEGALRSLLGDAARVVTLDLSENDQDPWNWINDRAREEPPGKVLFCVRGLGEMVRRAEAAGRPNPYAQLNFARDAWGSMGRHVLIWLDGLEAFDAFLLHAPDLWSHRDVVAWFLTRADFVPAEGPVGRDRVAEEIEQARRELEGAGSAELRVEASTRLAEKLTRRGEPLQAWEALNSASSALRMLRGRAIAAPTLTLAGVRCTLLSELGRASLAESELRQSLIATREAPDWLVTKIVVLGASLARPWRPETAIRQLKEAEKANLAPASIQTARSNLVATLGDLGQLRLAEEALRSLESDPDERVWVALRRSGLAEARGDLVTALGLRELVLRQFTESGEHRVPGVLAVALIVSVWGQDSEAEELLRSSYRGDVANTAASRAQLWCCRWRRSSPLAADTLADLLRDITTLTAHPIARAVAAQACSTLLETLETDAEPSDPFLPTLESTLLSIQRAAKADSDHEVDGWTRWSLARLALLRGDAKRAYSLADGHLIKWCHRWRGLIAESEIWALLARSAPTPTTALGHLPRALRAADESPSLYAQIAARRVAAQVHLRAGSLPAAVTALKDARAIARSEGLRPKELDVLHDLAELPGYPDARSAAREALALAEAMALPREEARALLNILEIARRAGEPVSARRLDRASEIVEELGPPRLRARVRAFAATAQA